MASKQGIFFVELLEVDNEHAMDGDEEEDLCICSFTGKGLRFVGRGYNGLEVWW